ncbi:MAG: LacI family DNA-binding transcriptional regulator [Chloroflexi bacterium]|nr:LacI family DNA-binding transcriptional regulator [Chloroflexota bacterium]
MANPVNRDRIKPPTMHDVAKLAGVSQSTVSRVLSTTPSPISISEPTRQKILDAAEQLRYRPNWTARSLRTLHTQMIAVLIADISNGFYHPMVRAIQDVARLHHYDVLIANSDHNYENERGFCEAILRRPVDGIVMVPYYLDLPEIDRLIKSTSAHIVVLGNHITHPAIDYVWLDDEQATFEAINWLLSQREKRRIGFIGVSDQLPPGPRRWHGFKRALDLAGLTVDPDLVATGDFSIESGAQAMQQLLKRTCPPFAVYACNDLMAIGAITKAQEMGYAVPQDIAVIGFDDIPEAQMITPKLTTIAQPAREIGKTLAQLLFDRIENQTTMAPRTITVKHNLIIRDSA